jgi:hypothetical protein
MKYRVCGKKTSGSAQQTLKPFFEVEVRLDGDDIKLDPSLDEI